MKRIYLEITNACNLNCPFCTYEKGQSFMPIEKVEDYIGQIRPFSSYVYLHILGEPLLHPDFEKILEILDGNGMNLQLVTNGTLLDRYPGLLKHPCLRKLSISLHSISDLDISPAYFTTIDHLLEENEDVSIELRFYDLKHLDLKLNNYLNSLKQRYSFEITAKKNSYQLKKNVYVYFEELFRWPQIDDPVIGDIGTCHGALDMLGITVDSKVTLCCLDPKAHNVIGSLDDNSFAQILSSPEYKKYVQEFKAHIVSSPLCRRCTYRLRFR